MSMITRIGFQNRTTSFMDTLIRPINAQFFRQPKEWSQLQRFGDSVWNIIDGLVSITKVWRFCLEYH